MAFMITLIVVKVIEIKMVNLILPKGFPKGKICRVQVENVIKTPTTL